MGLKRVAFFVNEKQYAASQKVRKQKQFPSTYALAKYYFLQGIEKDLKQNTPQKKKRRQ